jgi:uncharacterized protein (TIGR03435 family)
MWKLLSAIVVSGMLAVQLFAQAPPEPAFEVASVKPNKSGSGDVHFGIEGDRFTADNTPLKELIRVTYQVRDLQIIDAPDWIASERFNIVAKASAQLKPGVPPPELKQLMADRFGLRVHNETREMPIYALVLASAEGKLGPAVQRVDVDRCPEAMARAQARARSGAPATPPRPGQRMECGMRGSPNSRTGGSIGFGSLAQSISPVVGRVVIDRTGLTGTFDFELKWAQDPTADTTGPSIFTALQEQLGLKLESTRGPVDVLVIDRVERPSPD